MSIKLSTTSTNEELFEAETIECPPNTEGLFRYAETIVKNEIPEDKGQAYVLEMLRYGKKVWKSTQK